MKKYCVIALLLVPACAGPVATIDTLNTLSTLDPQIGPAEGSVVVRWDRVDDYVGKNACVFGRVVSANIPRNRCYLNFHENYNKYFTATIDEKHFSKFPRSPRLPG